MNINFPSPEVSARIDELHATLSALMERRKSASDRWLSLPLSPSFSAEYDAVRAEIDALSAKIAPLMAELRELWAPYL